MFDIFKTKIAKERSFSFFIHNNLFSTKDVIMNKSPEKVISIAEMHEDFYSKINEDIALIESYVPSRIKVTNKEKEKYNVLRNLGFRNEDVVSHEQKLQLYYTNKYEELKRSSIKTLMLSMKQKYPHYKFITIESLFSLCNKYKLVIGRPDNFIGTIPDKSIKDLSNFKVDNEDKAVEDIDGIISREFNDPCYPKTSKLRIAAHESLFREDSRNKLIHPKTVDDMLRVSNIEKDPIVFQAVEMKFKTDFMINSKGSYIDSHPPYSFTQVGFLIITAWGDEASDSNAINEKMN